MTTTPEPTVTVWISEHDTLPYVINTEHDMADNFRDMINESYPVVTIMGLDYDPARVLEEVDPIAFRCELSNYADGWGTELEMPESIFFRSDGADQRWVAEQLGETVPLSDEEREELDELRARFEAAGGRGVELAERIDALAEREDA